MRELSEVETLLLMEDIFNDIVKLKPRNTEANLKVWENAWQDTFNKNLKKPQYYNNYTVGRFKGKYVEFDSNTEDALGQILKNKLFIDYCVHGSNIFIEFGSGTGHNLVQYRQIFPSHRVIGTDWTKSSVNLIKSQNIEAYHFDMLQPNLDIEIDWSKTVCFTMHSMEQLGNKWVNFFKFLCKKRPMLVVHIEPIDELYDCSKSIDLLAHLYHKQRNYLAGYYTNLKIASELMNINIIEEKKSEFGSMYHDGYSRIVWRNR